MISIGDTKPQIVGQCATQLHAYWKNFTRESDQSMLAYCPQFMRLLVYGPLRDREDQKLEAAIAVKLEEPSVVQEATGSVIR